MIKVLLEQKMQSAVTAALKTAGRNGWLEKNQPVVDRIVRECAAIAYQDYVLEMVANQTVAPSRAGDMLLVGREELETLLADRYGETLARQYMDVAAMEAK